MSLSLEEIIRLIDESKFYRTTDWEQKRDWILERDNHECQICKAEGGFSPANTVHHIIPLKERPDLALDDDNLISICAGCHNREHPERFIQNFVEIKKSKLNQRIPPPPPRGLSRAGSGRHETMGTVVLQVESLGANP